MSVMQTAAKAARAWTHGPFLQPTGTLFHLWAPAQERLSLALEDRGEVIPMKRRDDGFFEVFVEGLGPGALYRFELANGMRAPDPASRFQPQDVHGPSETVDLSAYRWRVEWPGREWGDVALYELHVGAFTPEGTFAAATQKLGHLANLGVTAIQVMPLSDFPGRRGWGYDGAYPYAPDSSYGRPEDFMAFIDAAHEHGLAVILDVVYNHFGPEGNYLPLYAPDFTSDRHRTPWGEAINFDGANSRPVRDFFIENAEYWIEQFHLDGLRLDAIHAIRDDSTPHVLAELAERVRTRVRRPIHIVVENEENVASDLVRRDGAPLRFTAQWNDDIHHVLHVAATGEQDGYYAAYGSTELLARAIAEGFAYQGETMPGWGRARGGPSGGLPPSAFIAFIQNHDQIGNRAFGERIDALARPEAVRALLSVVLLSPQTPALFMGEEWGAASPFPFFCDFSGDLATAVRDGRRKEFSRFPQFADPEIAARIPDPTAEATFLSAKLDWSRMDGERLAFCRAALQARREHLRPLISSITRGGEAQVLGEQAVRVIWPAGAQRLMLDANLSAQRVEFPPAEGTVIWRCGETDGEFGPWSVRWSLQ